MQSVREDQVMHSDSWGVLRWEGRERVLPGRERGLFVLSSLPHLTPRFPGGPGRLLVILSEYV